jgi:uncharacterized protein YgbK (DUF1537 family)
VSTVLFTAPPTPQQLARHAGLRAFGVAGTTRSMPPDAMERTLRPALAALRDSGARIVHYKVCSTFDSSPTVGSIGRVIDVGADVFASRCVPVVVGAPALGRYCVFGNLFARCGVESEPFRLDRHPSMSRHPTTPMDEADLRLHLARQTDKPIGLLDVLALERPDVDREFERLGEENPVLLTDVLYERQLATVGRLLDAQASRHAPSFVVGSSGVEAALAAHWKFPPAAFAPVAPAGAPVLAVCGSCSPVTARQIDWAVEHGFAAVAHDEADARASAERALRQGRSVIVHSRRSTASTDVGPALGRLTREVLEKTGVRRVLVAGGDTSGQIAHALGIESMEMVGELTRGSPLVRVAAAPGSPADGIEMTFKGGQIGPVDFFALVEKGIRHG